MENAYERSQKWLLDAFVHAAIESVKKDQDPIMLAATHENLEYLRGVLMARDDRKKPPANKGERVRVRPDAHSDILSANYVRSVSGVVRIGTGALTIHRVWYDGIRWFYVFTGLDGYRFHAEMFVKAV